MCYTIGIMKTHVPSFIFLLFILYFFSLVYAYVDRKPTLFFVQTYFFTKECPGLGQPRLGHSLLKKSSIKFKTKTIEHIWVFYSKYYGRWHILKWYLSSSINLLFLKSFYLYHILFSNT